MSRLEEIEDQLNREEERHRERLLCLLRAKFDQQKLAFDTTGAENTQRSIDKLSAAEFFGEARPKDIAIYVGSSSPKEW